jgi:hypothetical protein
MPTSDPKSKAAELIEAASVNGDAFNADALFAEFKARSKPFTLNGEAFDLPEPGVWSDDVIVAAAENNILGLAQAIFGDQWDRFVAAGGGVSFMKMLYKKLHGVDLGE